MILMVKCCFAILGLSPEPSIQSLLVEDSNSLKESTHVHANHPSTIYEGYQIGLGWSGLLTIRWYTWYPYLLSAWPLILVFTQRRLIRNLQLSTFNSLVNT